MKTDEFIHSLAKNLRPVKRLSSPLIRFARWLLIAFLCLAAALTATGIRPDMGEMLLAPSFLISAVALFLLATLSSLSAFILSVPDRVRPAILLVPVLTLLLWLAVLIVSLTATHTPIAGHGLGCVTDIIVLAIIPGVLLLLMLRQAAPLEVGRVGFFAVLGLAGFGALGTQLVCRNDNPLHLLVWHYLPVVVLAGLGIALGRLVLNKNKL